MVWRALLNASDVPQEVLEPYGHTQWVGPGCHFIAYYIRRGKLVNIVTQQDTDQWVEEGWSTRGDPEEMRRELPLPRAARKTAQRGHGVLQVGPVHSTADAELGPRPDPTHRRCRACDVAQCWAGRVPGF